jgi:hypothetical protein
MFLELPVSPITPCSSYSNRDGLNCQPEDLTIIEKLKTTIEIFETDSSTHENPITKITQVDSLVCCRRCWQIYKETKHFRKWKEKRTSNYVSFIKILGNRFDECHCIAHLETIENISEENKWTKKQKMKVECEKCGQKYEEKIYISEWDQSCSHTIVKITD